MYIYFVIDRVSYITIVRSNEIGINVLNNSRVMAGKIIP